MWGNKTDAEVRSTIQAFYKAFNDGFTQPAGYAAEDFLMLAEDATFSMIQKQHRTTAPTVIRWKVRFLQLGMDGLDTHHPGQSASMLTPSLRAKMPRFCRQPGRSLAMDRRTGVAANWPRPLV